MSKLLTDAEMDKNLINTIIQGLQYIGHHGEVYLCAQRARVSGDAPGLVAKFREYGGRVLIIPTISKTYKVYVDLSYFKEVASA